MKLFTLLFFALSLLASCERIKGFSLKKIESHYHPSPEWEIPSQTKEELYSLLSEPYTYLGSGNHTYAFVSADGKTVIKFFKQKHMNTHTWKKFFYPKEKMARREAERKKTFNSYKIAFEKLKEETGILYLHLNKTHDLGMTLTLIDQHGKVQQIDLDKIEFLVQKKGVLAFDHLKKLIREDLKEEVLKATLSLLQIVQRRNTLGIYDKDLQFFKNFGFVGNNAIEIDIGEFRRDKNPANTLQELKTLSLQIRDFLEEEAPYLLIDFDQLVERELKQ